MADEPTLTEVLADVLETRVRNVHTAMPGKVRTYDHTTQTADIEPQLQLDGADLPVIPKVPIVWPLAYTDLTAGDTVLLIFCEADIGLWRQQGEPGEPIDDGRHGIHGAVAIAGLNRASSAKVFTAGSTVLPGTDLRLGAATAAQGVIQGTAYQAAMGAMLSAVQSALNSAGIDPALVAAAPLAAGFLVAAASAISTSGLTSTTAHVSTQVKVP